MKRSTYEMGVLELVDDGDVVELDVEVLVDALEGTAEADVVLKLDSDLVVDEGFKEAAVVPRSASASCVKAGCFLPEEEHCWVGSMSRGHLVDDDETRWETAGRGALRDQSRPIIHGITC